MKKCKITVIKRMFNQELADQYIPFPNFKPCEMMKEGDVFITSGIFGNECPVGFCQMAWQAICIQASTLAGGGKVFGHDEVHIACCNDGIRPVVFRLEMIEDDEKSPFEQIPVRKKDKGMVSKSEQLEELFIEWEYAQVNEPDSSWERTRGGKNITRSHFRRDGIIDEAVFSMEKRKVLFISNEANDDEYSAKFNPKPNSIDDYRKYYETGYDDWLGKMRERTSAIYKVVAEIGMNEMSDSDAAIHYAVMDLNKRGGGADVKDAFHIQEYCKYYKEFIKKEIDIINPDVVVWLGTKTYDIDIHINYLGAKQIGDKIYFLIGDKKIPILRMWHTSFYQGKIEPLQGYSNKIIGKLCAKCREEMKRYNLI